MLPASNRGVGMNLCFPDVCLTPTPAGPVPIPYPNIALNMQAVAFSPFVKVSMMNALNLASKIPVTLGDDAGTAHPTFKGTGAYVMGNPLVFVDKLPAINLTSLTSGNNMNAPVGAVIVPSAVNVFYTRLPMDERGDGGELDPYRREASLEEATALTNPTGLRVQRTGDLLTLGIDTLGPETAGLIFLALKNARFTGSNPPNGASVILDLQACPGGELDAFLGVAEIFLPEGAVLARTVDEDGDETEHRSRGGEALSVSLTVLIDGGTASAAELLAGALQAHGRANLEGSRTYGKNSAQCLRSTAVGASVFASSLRVLLPNGSDIAGVGVAPNAHRP